jgi:hypothetical protein
MKTYLLLASICVAGCGSPATLEPEYTGCGTDENWRTFDDQEKSAPMISDTTAPNITSPAAGATVPVAQVKLTWQQDPNDVGAPAGDVPYMDGTPGCMMCCPQFTIGGLQTLHLPPISGDVYDVQISVGGTLVHRVITTLQEWAPLTRDYATFAGKKLSIKIWRMAVLRNDVKQGPYVGTQPFTFSVGN